MLISCYIFLTTLNYFGIIAEISSYRYI